MSRGISIRGLFNFLDFDRDYVQLSNLKLCESTGSFSILEAPGNTNFGGDSVRWRFVDLIAAALMAFLVMWGIGALISYDTSVRGQDRALARTFAPVIATLYPQSGKERIAVVTIDDADLADYGEKWPASQSWYARRMLDLIPLKPRAIFIDLVFLGSRLRGGEERVVDAACKARLAGVPVYIASTSAPGQWSATESLYAAAQVETASGQRRPCIEFVGVGIEPDSEDGAMWHYQLAAEQQPPSVALQMFCQMASAAVTSPVCQQRSAASLSMEIFWSASPHANNARFETRTNKAGKAVHACRMSWSLMDYIPVVGSLLAQQRASREPGAPRSVLSLPLCPDHLWITARELNPLYDDTSSRAARSAVTGRFVLIGNHLESGNDVIYSPIHKALPGVFLHAMALDNLIALQGAPLNLHASSGEDVSRDERLFNVTGSLLVCLFTLLCLVIDKRILVAADWQQLILDHLLVTGVFEWVARAFLLGSCLLAVFQFWLDNYMASAIVLCLTILGCIIYSSVFPLWPYDTDESDITVVVAQLNLLLNIVSAVLKILAACWLIGFITYLALRVFHVGPLSIVVFALFGILIDWTKAGEKLVITVKQGEFSTRSKCLQPFVRGVTFGRFGKSRNQADSATR